MKEHLKRIIINESRHYFIYGENSKKRSDFLSNLEREYEIEFDKDIPMAIYLDDIGLPNKTINFKKTDTIIIYSLARNYLNFIIASNIFRNIILKLELGKDIPNLEERINSLLSRFNRLFVNPDFKKITSLEKLLEAFHESRKFYLNYFLDITEKGNTDLDISDLQIPFLDMNSFLYYTKKFLNNHSRFCVIADNQKDIHIVSKKAINGIVTSRINEDLSMKVASDINNWNTYLSLNGVLAQSIHDYGVIELDDNYNKQLRRVMKRNDLDY